jgi:hypothetical protein
VSQYLNLLNPALRPPRDWLSALPITLFLLINVLILSVAWSVLRIQNQQHTQLIEQKQSELNTEQTRLQHLQRHHAQPNATITQSLALTEQQLNTHKAALLALEKGDAGRMDGFSAHLRGLARQHIEGLWLTQFRAEANGHHTEIQGQVIDPTLISRYVQRLSKETAFAHQRFATLSIKPATNTPNGASNTLTDQPKILSFTLTGEDIQPTKEASSTTSADTTSTDSIPLPAYGLNPKVVSLNDMLKGSAAQNELNALAQKNLNNKQATP